MICVVCGACAQTNCCRAPKQTYAAARHREHARYRHNCPAQRDTESNQECLVPPRSAQASLQPCGTTGSCGASQKKGRRKSAHLSSAGKKSSLTMMKRNRKRKRTTRTGAKRRHIAGRAYNTGRGRSKTTSNGSERGSRFMLGSQRSHCHNQTNSGFVYSSEGVGRKG